MIYKMSIEESNKLILNLEELNNVKSNCLNAKDSLVKEVNKDFDEKKDLLHVFQEKLLDKIDIYCSNRKKIIDKIFFNMLEKWLNKRRHEYLKLNLTNHNELNKKLEVFENELRKKLSQIDREIFGRKKMIFQVNYLNLDETHSRDYNCLSFVEKHFFNNFTSQNAISKEIEFKKDEEEKIISNILLDDRHNDRIIIYYVSKNLENSNLNKNLHALDGSFVENSKLNMVKFENQMDEIWFIKDYILVNQKFSVHKSILRTYDENLVAIKFLNLKEEVKAIKTDKDKIFIFYNFPPFVQIYSENFEKLITFGQNLNPLSAFYLDVRENCKIAVKNEHICIFYSDDENKVMIYNYLKNKVKFEGSLRKKYDFLVPINSSILLVGDYEMKEITFFNLLDSKFYNPIVLKYDVIMMNTTTSSNIFILQHDYKIIVFSASYLM